MALRSKNKTLKNSQRSTIYQSPQAIILVCTSSQQRLLTAALYSMRAHSLSRCSRKRGNSFFQFLPSAHGKISYLLSSSSSSMVLARYLQEESESRVQGCRFAKKYHI